MEYTASTPAGLPGCAHPAEGKSRAAARPSWLSITGTFGIRAAIVAFCLTLVGAIWTAVVMQAQSEREMTIAAAIRQNSNLAMAFEEHSIRTVAGADAAALFIAHFENIPRYMSFRTLPGYPLVVAVGTSQDEVLAQFFQNRHFNYWGALLLSAVIATFGALLIAVLSRQKRAVDALAGSSAQFRATFEQAAVGIAHTTLDRHYLLVNQKFCDMLGYARDELLALRSTAISHPDEQEVSDDNRRALAGELDTYAGEKRYIRKDGSVLWVNRTVSLARDGAGQPLYFIRVVEDISQRKLAEERLSKVARARKVMAECNRVLVHADDEAQLLNDMCKIVVESGGYRLAWVGFAEDDKNKPVRRAALAGLGEVSLDAALITWGDHGNGRGPVGEAMRSGRSCLVRNVLTDARSAASRDNAREHGYGSIIVLPLRQQRVPFGVLTIRAREIDAFDEEEVTLLEELAADLAYGIVSLRARINHKRVQATLNESEELMRSTFDNAAVGIVHTSLDGKYLRVNRKFTELLGYSREELLTMQTSDINHPDELPLHGVNGRRVLSGEIGEYVAEKRFVRKDGTVLWAKRTVSLVRDAAGKPLYFIRVTEDITARKQTEDHLNATFHQAAVGIMHMAPDRTVLRANAKFCTMLGFAPDEIIGRNMSELRHPDDAEARSKDLRQRENGAETVCSERRWFRKDGSVLWANRSLSLVRDASGQPDYFVGLFEDITDRKRLEERLVHEAQHDGLTRLPNRSLVYDRLGYALDQARRRSWALGVMFIDLDRFKRVNDTVGHGKGDQLLQQVAARLAQCVRAEDTVGRVGGDEFAVILSDLKRAEDAGPVAQKIIDALAAPFDLDGHEVFVTASIGIAAYPNDSDKADDLIKSADTAMYRAKELGKNNYQFYTAEMNERTAEKLRLENNLRGALQREEFVLHFQPKASLISGKITGVEALLRWQLPTGRLVPPMEFIPLLEESGLIVPVGEWVLRAACRQIAAWQQEGVAPVPIAVNLSAKQFQRQDICAMVTRALHESGVDPSLLELELTESAAMLNAEGTIATLRNLKALGVRIALDDFGTGYSSLSYLKRFPIDSLKIDRSFIIDLPGNDDDASITQAVITMAHALRLKVVAEGVENEAQLTALAANGCDEMQGYYFSRPLPAPECTLLLLERRTLPQPATQAAKWRPPTLGCGDGRHPPAKLVATN